MTPAKVLHVAAELSIDLVAFLAPVLRELSACGVRQTLLHAGPAAAVPHGERVRRVALDLGGRPGCAHYLRTLRAALRVELASHDYQALHLHGPGAAWAARPELADWSRRVPVFYSPHGLAGQGGLRALADAAVLAAGRVRRAVPLQPVSCCEIEARRLLRLGGQPATLLCMPVDERLFTLERRRSTPPTVVGLGDACAPRAPEQFAELAARFHFAGQKVRFVWAGIGTPHYERLLRAADVTLTGWDGAHDAADTLVGASAVVLTGRSRGAPLPLAQAMAAGAPLAAMDLPGHRELLRHGVSALLAADLGHLALQVKSLLDDRPRAEALGAQARAEARRRFPPERFRQSLRELYRVPVPDAVLPALAQSAAQLDAAAP